MAHVWILRECPSFVEGEKTIHGTHEDIEKHIASRKYPLNLTREGYCIPASSEVKLICYRIKKECIGDFLNDLRPLNLNPDIPFWKLVWNAIRMMPLGKKQKSRYHLMFGGFLGFAMIGIRLTRIFGIKFYGHNIDTTKENKPFTTAWNYNFFLGYFEDPKNQYGQEEL